MSQQSAEDLLESPETKLLDELVILYPAFKTAVDRLQECLDYSPGGRSRCAACFDPSGTGKSHLAKYFTSKYPHVDGPEGRIMPVLNVRLLPGLSIKQAAGQILEALRDPMFMHGNAFEKTHRICYFFKKCKVRMLILDEANHFVDNRMKIVSDAAEWLKHLIESTKVSVVLLGVESSIQLLLDDVQLRRRFSAPFTIDPFTWTEEDGGGGYISLLDQFTRAELKVSMGMRLLPTWEFAYRLFCASSGMIGYTAKFIEEAIVVARNEKATELTQEHFEAGFTRTFIQEGARVANPFAQDIEPEPINVVRLSRQPGGKATRKV